jgi:FkbM family methyltransferase
MNNLLDFRDGFYIEAGANDGVSQSNTQALEVHKNWSGLLIEPNHIRFAECKANRSDRNIFEHCALVSPDHKKLTIRGNFAEQDLAASLMAQVTIPLDYYDIHQRTAAIEKQTRTVISVPAQTLQSLIDKHNIKKIDFLSLDVEGYEYEAMNGLSFDKNPPRFIRVETSQLPERIEAMKQYVESKGYQFVGRPADQGKIKNDCFFQLK